MRWFRWTIEIDFFVLCQGYSWVTSKINMDSAPFVIRRYDPKDSEALKQILLRNLLDNNFTEEVAVLERLYAEKSVSPAG